MRFGMTFTEAMGLSMRERSIQRIVLGIKHGGEYDFKKGKWVKPATVL